MRIADEMITEVMKAEQRRIELAIRGAILADYDGVDVNRDVPGNGIASIKPWHYPAPGMNNGYMTARYTWAWFSDENLKEAARTGRLPNEMVKCPHSERKL